MNFEEWAKNYFAKLPAWQDTRTEYTVAKAAWEAAQPKWQPIETAPLGGTVLLFYDNDSRKKRIIRAQYVNAYTEEASEESIDCGFYDYCGETDEYYTPEGWYELVDNSCEYSSYRLEATNKPTHWMPLPSCPAKEEH